MNKLLKGLLVTALFAGSMNAADTNKTFLMPRSHGVNMAMEYTTWNELVNMDKEDRFGANFQVIGFYQGSTDDSDRGKYFGVNDLNKFEFSGATATQKVYSPFVIHDRNIAIDSANLKVEADQDAYGAKIFYFQDLEKILKGLYLKANLPIVHVQNDLNFNVSDVAAAGTITQANIYNYFKGSFIGLSADHNAQEALTNAKIDGSQSTTSVADIDIALGYKFLDKENYHMSINLGFTIPTGTKADGIYLWEPIVGNGKHWALGAGLDFGATLWDKDDQNIKLAIALNYRYLFSATEKRTIGLKDKNWGQYFLIGKVGGKVTPAANLLTQNVKVETGSQLDGIVEFAYNNGGFSIELGYNLFWKDSESVSLKDTAWYTGDANTYGLMHQNYNSAGAAIVDADATWSDGTPGAAAVANLAAAYKITADHLNVDAAASESQVTNKIYGGLGYIFKEWEYPLLLGVGAQYEFASRDAVQNWGLWGKIGIGF